MSVARPFRWYDRRGLLPRRGKLRRFLARHEESLVAFGLVAVDAVAIFGIAGVSAWAAL